MKLGQNFRMAALFCAAGLLAISTASVFGQADAPKIPAQEPPAGKAASSFEEVSIRRSHPDVGPRLVRDPGRFTLTNSPIIRLVQIAYNVRQFQITGAPKWATSEDFDIEAKIDDTTAQAIKTLTFSEYRALLRPMLQALLADRFALKVSHQTEELPVYALVVAKGGPKLSEVTLAPSTGPVPIPQMPKDPAKFGAYFTLSGPISDLANALSDATERHVIDKTGLTGNYGIFLQWAPDENHVPTDEPQGAAAPAEFSGPSLSAALQEQLGLKLVPGKGPVEVIVIDHVERPSEN